MTTPTLSLLPADAGALVHQGEVTIGTAIASAEGPRRRLIRPPDPAIRDITLSPGRYSSAEACRRLVHLAFRDAHTALDLTHAAGGFWKAPAPPGLVVTSNNRDPFSSADLHLDFTATGLGSGSYDLVVYDPPHIADGGTDSIMAGRYGTIATTDGLRELIEAGAREAWRIATVGVIVKVADHHHGGRYLTETAWVQAAIDAPLYTKLETYRRRPLLCDRHQVEMVPRNNGATYLVFRHAGPRHLSFQRLWERQEASRLAAMRKTRACSMCDMPIGDRRAGALTCSPRCRQRARRTALPPLPAL